MCSISHVLPPLVVGCSSWCLVVLWLTIVRLHLFGMCSSISVYEPLHQLEIPTVSEWRYISLILRLSIVFAVRKIVEPKAID